MENPASTFAKIVGLFVLVGAGLGASTLLYLWVAGFFDPSDPDDLGAALGQSLVGSLAIAVVLVFALLIGVVIATIGGLHAATSATSRLQAAAIAGLSSGIGHALMVGILGLGLIAGIDLLSERADVRAEPTPTPRTTAELEECRALFGQDSPLCEQEEEELDPFAAGEDSEVVATSDLIKLGLGVIPAALVGTLSSAMLFSRRRSNPPPVATIHRAGSTEW